MGNDFNGLRWKIIWDYNIQFIHQFTIEFKFRMSLAQERFKVTTHSNNRNSKSSREVILGSVRLWQSVILRNYDMFSTDSNARYTARW